jgi:transcriptional regulator with XRE-family HTH domain
MEDFTKRLNEILTKLNISKTALAEQIGVTKQVLNKWFNHSSIPDGKTLILFKKKFNISIDWLLTGVGSMYGGEDSSHDDLIDSLKSELLDKENQLQRVREAIQSTNSATKTTNTVSKALAAKLVKGNPGRSVKQK